MTVIVGCNPAFLCANPCVLADFLYLHAGNLSAGAERAELGRFK